MRATCNKACFFLVLLLFLLFSNTAKAANNSFSDLSGLTGFLEDARQSGSTDVDFTCSRDLYSALKENDFFSLYRILVKAGIDYGQVLVSYNDFRHYIQISNISYSNYPWRECDDFDEVRLAIRELAHNQSGFILLCSAELTGELSEGYMLHRALVQSGIESYRNSVSVESGIIRITNISYLPVPYALVEDYAQFASAIAGFESMGVNDFYIAFTPELFERINNDKGQYTVMVGSSRLGSYRSGTDSVSCTIRFSDVEFTDFPREICREIADVPEAIRRMGTAGIRNFELIFPDTAVFNALYENDFALLMSLQANAGMSDGKISYSSSSDRIIFTDAEITANAVMLETLADAIAYTERLVREGETDIHLFCTAGLFQMLMGDLLEFAVVHNGMNRIYDLIAHAGIFNYDLSSVRASHVINIHINRLYPGTAIMNAVRSGDYSSLSQREMETWAAAAQIAASSLASTPLETARAVHDWICDHASYAEDEWTDEDDNAIGAILNGRANCDGYSDAFYLIGSLAGLDIRYQHGDSYYKDPVQLSSAATHLWNLLEIDGLWHMVDVTWDDQPEYRTYHWFNAGRDVANEKHFWNEDMTVPLAAY